MLGITGVGAKPNFRGSTIDLSHAAEKAFGNRIVPHCLARPVDRMAIEPRQNSVPALARRIVMRGEVMGQINHKAGIAPGGTRGNLPRLEDNNLRIWRNLSKAPGCRQSRKASTHHRNVARHSTGKHGA